MNRELVFLRTFSVATVVGIIYITSTAFKKYGYQKFSEIDVERINIVEKDGTVKMILTNVGRFPNGTDKINNRPTNTDRKKRSGMLFFNEDGIECGGFIYDGQKTKNGHASGLSLTYDQYDGDQVMQLLTQDTGQGDNRFVSSMLAFNDRPSKESQVVAYYYYLINKKTAKKIASYNRAMTESKINQLKAQLNPHFLFNNLNVLDQLIEEDKDKASDFLNEFAEIYRYVLQSTDKELVRIEDEIDFAKQYYKLIQYKYNNAYQLQIEYKSCKGLMVPMTLQVLIENAIQHNLGTEQKPVCIQIKIDKNISVCNNTYLKHNRKAKSERALKNLKEQYRLLSEKSIQIHQTEKKFLVEIPILHNHSV